MPKLDLPRLFSLRLDPSIHHPLVENPPPSTSDSSASNGPTTSSRFAFFTRFFSRRKVDGGLRTEEEDKVYRWLYAIAQCDKDMVFEYVGSTERGLTFQEAAKRLQENGPNTPVEYQSMSWWILLWTAFFHPFNLILLILSALSYFTYDTPNGCIMLVLVLISVSLRFYQEYSSSKAALKLSEYLRYPVRVQRCEGRTAVTELKTLVDQSDIVPGDIVHFGPGDLFPGDVRLISSKDLVVSQSSLTGESGVVEKTADIREDKSTPLLELRNICFMGTNVESGSGVGLVVSTRSRTYMSTMFASIGKSKPKDDFEKGIRHISYILIVFMVVIATVIGLTDYLTSKDASESFLFAISVACALTPQMLPLIINTGLAKGALAMARQRCIVKSVAAIRNMGSIDILCIDKTGTLTRNQVMMYTHIDIWKQRQDEVLRVAFLNSFHKQQKNPLDVAIMGHVYTNGFKFQPQGWRKIHETPFDFTRRRVSIVLEPKKAADGRGSRYMMTKGALEEVITICSSFMYAGSGEIREITAEYYQKIQQLGEELSQEGLRVLGVAMKRMQKSSDGMIAKHETEESNLIFLGVVTFYDPPKATAKEALWRLARKGVKAKVLTGDSLPLAIRVCDEVGIKTTQVTTGPDLESLTETEFHETIRRATVLARLTPTQKLRVIKSLQTNGDHVVGFLGDGINDSLALEAANVGVSVDSGAPVAKHFADIILLEKDLNVLVNGVEEGRLTFANTMKYIKMSVVANIGGVLSLLIATIFLQDEPLTPRQLLVQNFLYSLGQIAIPWDKMEDEYLNSPQRWSKKGFPMFVLWNAPICSMCDVATLLFLWFYYQARSSSDIDFFRSALFVEGLLMQTLIIHLIRTQKIPFIQEVASWPVIVSTLIISAIGIAIPYSPIGDVMEFVELPLTYFGFLVVLFVGYFAVGQAVKRLYIFVYNQWL